ncbi:four-carbon acid sugar kinase family protein [Acidisphaera sp. S103]|uniref:four-carbon acid sugar kinase family protein n=1 Tax=Acidisphaera sp. S103 TaxID=1747223 RepID=UPI00131ECB6B|nr:four-carbon acid sugar kinase family protein [Acidisphaera sp. S103]
MTSLRLLADDLTGALDSAAEFVALTGPVRTFWHGAIPAELPDNAALDSGTRELDARSAAGIVHRMAPHIASGGIAFKKIDSLLRGHAVVELAACMRGEGWRYCVLAPAFPYQGRITKGGRQHARDAGGAWRPVGDDLVAALREAGVRAQPGALGIDLQPGITVFDAETDDDLAQVVAAVRRHAHRVLWSGTGGLAQALAAGASAPFLPPLPGPILGLFGSDQPVMAAQLAACAPHWIDTTDTAAIRRRLDTAGLALASFPVPAGTSRDAAARHIAEHCDGLARALPRPGTLIAAGGETLRTVCKALGATSLEVHGRIVPGVPRSIMCGGRWDGVTVISKSGAFGHTNLLRELLALERSAS